MRPPKQLINMSFVNPIVDFLPLILFNIVGNYWGLPIALYLSLPLAISFPYFNTSNLLRLK